MRKPSLTAVMMAAVIVIALLLLAETRPVKADSPLTSTGFYKAYTDIPMVRKAEKSDLNDEIFRFLIDSGNAIDQRAAVVNAMGWNIDGKRDGSRFIAALADRLGKSSRDLKISDLSADQRLLLGYMLAMDDYFTMGPSSRTGGELETSDALKLVSSAAAEKPSDFTVQIITALVRTQKYLKSQWELIYPEVGRVVDSNMDRNMRDSAVSIIMEYIGEYRKYAKMSEIKRSASVTKPIAEIPYSHGISEIVLSPDEKRMISMSNQEKVAVIWSIESRKVERAITTADFPDCCSFSPDGETLAISDFSPAFTFYSGDGFSEKGKLEITERVVDIAWFPTGRKLALGRFDGIVDIYSYPECRLITSFKAHDSYIATAGFSPDGSKLLTAGYDRTVKMWDIRDGYRLLYTVDSFRDGAFAYFMQRGRLILARDYSGSIKVLDAASGEIKWERQLTGTVHDVCSDGDGKLVAAAVETGVIYLWSWCDGAPPRLIQAHRDQAMSVRLSEDGRRLYTAGLDRCWKTWDAGH